MIGYQLLVTEQENKTFIADKVSAYFSIELNMVKDKSKLSEEAKRLYELQNGEDINEFVLTFNELEEISKATNCISENSPGYHKYACDGIIVIPKSKDKFLSFKEFKDNTEG